jgi:hypothetical protein
VMLASVAFTLLAALAHRHAARVVRDGRAR